MQAEEINLENPSPADIAKYSKGFENVKNELNDYIDLLNDLPYKLEKHGILTDDEADNFDITKRNATREIVKKLDKCLKNNSEKCLPILKALRDDDQIHIAKYIVSSGMNTGSPDRVLTKEEWETIDQNMFCLEKLVRVHVGEYLHRLVQLRCIAKKHKEFIQKPSIESEGVYHLFDILKKRSFTHLTIFKRFLREIGHSKIIDVLEKGGVIEITSHLRGITNLSVEGNIERGIIEQLCGYLDEDTENKLNEEHKSVIRELITLLNKHRTQFIACYPTNSISLYFQCETKKSQEWLVDSCKHELKTLYQRLQPELNRFPNFNIDVNMTNSSKILRHSIVTESHFNSGKNSIIRLMR